MSGLIAKIVFNKILRESPENNQGKDDPYFESVPAGRLSVAGHKKTKRRKKALPPGLSREDEKTLVKVKRRAYRLDMAFGNFCGMKVGWSSLIAIIPVIGDVLDLLLSLMVIRTASEAKLPYSVQAQMTFNVIIDFLIGLVPLLGDLVDIAFKANTRNAIILENFLRERGAENLGKVGHRRHGTQRQLDPSLVESFDRDERHAVVSQRAPPQPAPSYQPGRFLGGLFGGGERVDDIEAQRANLLSIDHLEPGLPGVSRVSLLVTGLRDTERQGAILRGITVGKVDGAWKRGYRRRRQTGTITARSKDDVYELGKEEAADIYM